jgi:nucleoside 2-deoxyribosyltransferase
MKTIYLANPYGFSDQWNRLCLPPIVARLRGLGLEVWEPFAKNNQVDLSKPGWAYEIGQRDVKDARTCDAIFAIVNGTPPDEGVMVELGICIALGKPTFLFRDDFRKCTDSEDYPLNLMLFTGMPASNWQDYYYTNETDLHNPNKALAKWVWALEP